jgi:hypothetical protein
LANIHLQPGHDEFCWNLHENGKFSVASMYNALIQSDIPFEQALEIEDSITDKGIWMVPT